MTHNEEDSLEYGFGSFPDICFGDAKIEPLSDDHRNRFLFLNEKQTSEVLFDKTHFCVTMQMKESQDFVIQFGAGAAQPSPPNGGG